MTADLSVRVSRKVLRSYISDMFHKDLLRKSKTNMLLCRRSCQWLVDDDAHLEDGDTSDILFFHGRMLARRCMMQQVDEDADVIDKMFGDLISWLENDCSTLWAQSKKRDKKRDKSQDTDSKSLRVRRTVAVLKGMLACFEASESQCRAAARMERKNRQQESQQSCTNYSLAPPVKQLTTKLSDILLKGHHRAGEKETISLGILLASIMIRLLNLYKSPHCASKDNQVDILLQSTHLNEFLLKCLGDSTSEIVTCQTLTQGLQASCEFALSWCMSFHRLFADHHESFSAMLALIIASDSHKFKQDKSSPVAIMDASSDSADKWGEKAFFSLISNCTRNELGLICRCLLMELSRVMKMKVTVDIHHQFVKVVTLSRSFLQSFSSESKRWGLVAPLLTRFMSMVSTE